MKEKIRNFELLFLNISAILGVGILSLPRRAAEGAGASGVFSIAIAGLIITAVTYLYAKLAVRYEKHTIFEFGEFLWGKFLTRASAVIFSIYFITLLALEIRVASSSIKLFLLYNTPIEVIIITLLLISAIAVNYGLPVIAKLCSNYSVLSISALLIILALSLKYFNPENLYSIFSISPWETLKTAFKLTTGYLSFSIIVFVAPQLAEPKKLVRTSVFATLIVTILYTLTVLVSFGEFSIIPNQYLMYPTETLTKSVFIGGFAERIDLLFMTFWILSAYISLTVRLFILSYSLSRVVPQKNYSVFTFLSLPLIYILSLIIQNDVEVEMMIGLLGYAAWFILIPITAILFILSLVRKSSPNISSSTKLGSNET